MQKASESLYKIFKATIEDFGVTMENFASFTTDSGLLAEMAKTTHLALRDAFVSRHCGLVWDSETSDPSFVRDVPPVLMLSFAIKPILKFIKLRTNHDE